MAAIKHHLASLKPLGMKKALLFACFYFVSSNIGAQTALLSEQFDYPAGAPLRDHGWNAHSAGTTNPINVASSGLSLGSTPYFGNGIGRAALVNNTGSDENRPLSTYRDTGSVYASFLVKANAAVTADGSGFFFHFVTYSDPANPVFTSISTAFRGRTYITTGTTPAQFRLGLTFNSATVPNTAGVDVTNDLDTSKTYLVVVKYKFVSGADNDSVSMFVFENGDSIANEPATPTIGPLAGTAADASIIQGIALRQYNAAQNILVDGIFVRDQWLMQPDNTSVRDDAFGQSVEVFPNPWNGGPLHIRMQNADQAMARLLDLQGKRLWEQAIDTDGNLQIPQLPAGMYLLQIEQAGKLAHKRLVIR